MRVEPHFLSGQAYRVQASGPRPACLSGALFSALFQCHIHRHPQQPRNSAMSEIEPAIV